MDDLKKLTLEIEELKKTYKEKAKAALLNDVFPGFFKSHPEIKAVYWCQYTPYFNDGDPCVFNVGEVCLSNIEDFESNDNFDGYYESYIDGKYTWELDDKKLETDFSVVAAFISSNKNLMLDLYGDHSTIVIHNSDPIEASVSEYDHD